MVVVAASLAAFLLLGAEAPPPEKPRPPAPEGLSWGEADSLARTLIEVRRHVRGPRTKEGRVPPRRFEVTQGQANSYVNLRLQPQLPAGLQKVNIEFSRGKLIARGVVDLDQVKTAVQADSMLNPMSYLSGVVPVEIQGVLKTDNGFGQFEIEDARLGPVMVPASVLHQIVAAATRSAKDPQGFDILSPFRLPYSLQRVHLRPGKLVLEF